MSLKNALSRGPVQVRARRCAGFTLMELIIVTAIIVLLMSIILPSVGRSVRQARSTVCQSNLKDLYRSLDMYVTENAGWLPVVAPGEDMSTTETWASTAFQNNPAGKAVLICPDDPWAGVMRKNLAMSHSAFGGNTSYGLNDFIMSSPGAFMANIGRYTPKRPSDTILAADMGPDRLVTYYSGGSTVQTLARNAGRLAIDDGYTPGDPPEYSGAPWLTDRHMGKINVLTIVGNVKSVDVVTPMRRPVQSYYENCAALSCTICTSLTWPHYSFAESQAFWWTGPLPVR